MKDYKSFFKRILFTEAEVVGALKDKKNKVAKVYICKIDTHKNASYHSINHPDIRYQVKFLDLKKYPLNGESYFKVITDSIDEAIKVLIDADFDYYAIPSLFKTFHFMRRPNSEVFYSSDKKEHYAYITGVYQVHKRNDMFESLVSEGKEVAITKTFKDATYERISALKNSINPIFNQLKDFPSFKFALTKILDSEKVAIVNSPIGKANTGLGDWFNKFITMRNNKK